MRQRRLTIAALLLLCAAIGVAAIATGQDDPKRVGRIGPDTRIQPSGRKLDPAGRLSERLGNLPAGGVLTANGRYLITASAGRGHNDLRVVAVDPKPCGRYKTRRKARACARKRRKRIGRVTQVLPMPGVSGGMALSGDRLYVSGLQESEHKDQQVADDVPGRRGDVIHVLAVDQEKGRLAREDVIQVPVPGDAPMIQNFPPSTARRSYPRDVAVSPDGTRLLVALNLADRAAVIDIASKRVRYVATGSYPYGAAITRDGKRGLVSNEADGTVSVVDLESARELREIRVGPNLSHPEGIAVDPSQPRAYVAVANQDVVAVLDLEKLAVERTLSVERPEGIGTAPVALSVSPDGRRLLVADSGEDAIAVFSLPATARPPARRARGRARAAAERILAREARRALRYAEEDEDEAPAARLAQAARDFELIGRIPVGSYPVGAWATERRLVWLAAKGLGAGPNPNGPRPTSPDDSDDRINSFQYLPSNVFGIAGARSVPSDAAIRAYTPRAARQVRPVNDQPAPPGSPVAGPGPSPKIKHVFYIVRENRSYDQVLGDDPRGDGDPKLTLFGPDITPNAHALAQRFPLLDHVYANSEASIDGHFWTSAAAVSDYVVKDWHQNYGGRGRPYDFGVYSVTWPSRRFLFDQAQKQNLSWFNFGEAVAGVVPLTDRNRTPQDTADVTAKLLKSDLGQNGCFANVAGSGGTDAVTGLEVYDPSLPAGAPLGSTSRFDCFRLRFNLWVATNSVPAFVYATFANDHTSGTRPGSRTPKAMVAENDLALGQVVDLISHSPIWRESLILVIEDDSQDGADHVDAHRIPAFAISPYAKAGAVIHTRYDFLSFIRTLENVVGMKPLNLFDATAVPLYDAFDGEPANAEPYTAIVPQQPLLERNTAASANARLSRSLRIGEPGMTDRTPQRVLDRIIWQSVHGPGSEPPPPGPNHSALEAAAARRLGIRPDGSVANAP